jgi:hypothetical protein
LETTYFDGSGCGHYKVGLCSEDSGALHPFSSVRSAVNIYELTEHFLEFACSIEIQNRRKIERLTYGIGGVLGRSTAMTRPAEKGQVLRNIPIP